MSRLTKTIMAAKKAALAFFGFVLLQGAATAQPALEKYIEEGLTNNVVLKQKSITLDKSLIALKEAKSLYLPTTWLEGSYTLAQGGRAISLPVGDLLNPVYQTLNQLTSSEKFPAISNVEEQFLPNNFYDVRIKTTMPIINSDLRYNRNIKEHEVRLKENEVTIYKRELIREIKNSYYSVLMASKAISIYENALTVVKQNLKLNQSLLTNGKGLPAYVSRAESEVKSVEAQVQNAKNEHRKAKAYLNVLLNRGLNEMIVEQDPPMQELTFSDTEEQVNNVMKREEFRSLMIAREINNQLIQKEKSFRAPKLNGFLDLAAQDFKFRVNNNSFFYMGGLQVTVPIFSGNRNLYNIKQAELDLKQLDLTTTNTRNQLQLAAFNSGSNARNFYNNYIASLSQEESSSLYFKLIDRGFKEGINTYIELLDARNQLTQSQLQSALSKFRFLAAMADFERQTSSYIMN
jgi:outer membrane protein